MTGSSYAYIENKIREKAAEDINFRKSLIANPRETIKKELNVNVPDDVDVKVVEDSAKTVYIVLPPLSGDEAVAWW